VREGYPPAPSRPFTAPSRLGCRKLFALCEHDHKGYSALRGLVNAIRTCNSPREPFP